MGVNSRVFDVLATHCKAPLGGAMLVAGYPDFVVRAAVVAKHFGRSDFPPDAQSAEICAGHAEPGLDYSRDPFSVFGALGYSMKIIDFVRHRGMEEIVDLNEPWEGIVGGYDLVLDHGTIEHCFNIGQAAVNLASSVARGGYIVQHLPLNLFNHGFYNINPTWFFDFYGDNGFTILHIEGWNWRMGQPFGVKSFEEFDDVPARCLTTMVARRDRMQEIRFPIQRRYRPDTGETVCLTPA